MLKYMLKIPKNTQSHKLKKTSSKNTTKKKTQYVINNKNPPKQNGLGLPASPKKIVITKQKHTI